MAQVEGSDTRLTALGPLYSIKLLRIRNLATWQNDIGNGCRPDSRQKRYVWIMNRCVLDGWARPRSVAQQSIHY